MLPDFEAVALNGREVVLAFDSDIATKPDVRKALRRFRAWLESRGARTLVCVFPHDGKVGMDDYLAAGGTREALQSLAVHTLPDIPGAMEPAGTGQPGIAPGMSGGDGTVTLTEVVEAFEDRLELSDPDPLFAMLGTKAALALPGDPVWLLVIDGSSGGKTEMLMPLAALPDVSLCALLTEAGLLSGTSRKERAENATGGVLRQVGDRGVILMKDFTSVLSMQRDTRAADARRRCARSMTASGRGPSAPTAGRCCVVRQVRADRGLYRSVGYGARGRSGDGRPVPVRPLEARQPGEVRRGERSRAREPRSSPAPRSRRSCVRCSTRRSALRPTCRTPTCSATWLTS